MADYYIDISAVGNEYQAYNDTPTTWAVPEDGNGKAGPGHSAAVPLAEVTFAAVPTSGAISVYGVTVTLTGVLSAASTAAAATALASSINATTTATGTAVCQALLPLNRFVYARVKPGGGANDSVVQVMCRIAGADLNYASGANASARITNTFNNSAMTSPVDFAGGADGPYAYLLNTATVFGKSAGTTGTSYPQYGLFFNAAPGPAEPAVATDVLHVRTRRSGVDLSVTWSSTGTASGTWKQRNYLFDDGTAWSGDNGKLTATFKNANASSVTAIFTVPSAGQVSFASRGTGNFEVQTSVTTSGSGQFTLFSSAGSGAKLSFKRCRWVEASDNVRILTFWYDGGSSITGLMADLSDSFVQLRSSASSKFVVSFGASGSTGRVVLNGVTVEVLSASSAIGTFIAAAAGVNGGTIEWVGGEVRDSLGVYRCVNPCNLHVTTTFDVLLDGVVGITDPAIGLTASATNFAGRMRWSSPEGPNKGYRDETARYMIDWKGDGTFPYAGAAANLQAVNWSHRFTWGAAPTAWMPATFTQLRRFYRSAAATKTVTVELYLPTATTVYLDELELTVSYMDSTDVWRTESVGGARGQQFSSTRTALSSSSTSWTANGVASYGAKKIELTTAYAIKQNSEIIARLSLCASRGSSLTGYYSPELGVA